MRTNTTDLARQIQYVFRRGAAGRSFQLASGLAVGSLQGPVREDNQDRAALAYITPVASEAVLVALVCDGLGGMAEGGAAAGLAASYFLASLACNADRVTEKRLLEYVHSANAAVFERFRGEGGTTLTALVVVESGPAWIIHVGDSRAYEVDGESGLRLLTNDDTVAGVVNRAHEEEPDEDNLDNRLLQFVGVGEGIEPHVQSVSKVRDRTFLLTSDGAHSIGRRMLEGIVKSPGGPAEWVRRLTFVAEAVNIQDNSSAVSLSVRDFVAPPRLSGGAGLKIWSPLEVLDYWFQEPLREQGTRPAPTPAPGPLPKPRKPKRATKTAAQPITSQKNKKRTTKPQLTIKFGGEGEA